jgi:hypothetical protein
MSTRRVTCSACGAALPRDFTQTARVREPCPSCGSLKRTVHLSAQGFLGLSGSATVVAHADAVAQAQVAAQDAHVTTTESVAPTEPELTSTGLEVKHSGQVKWAPLDNGTWLAEVVSTGGEIKTGIGDDLSDALLELILYLLPSDHPQYPKD